MWNPTTKEVMTLVSNTNYQSLEMIYLYIWRQAAQSGTFRNSGYCIIYSFPFSIEEP